MATKAKRQGTKRAAKDELILTPGEALFLWRKRKGVNQSKFAKEFGCSLFNYKKAEYDSSVNDFKYPKIEVTPYLNERCVIYRRRSGLLQKDIAKKTGVSRYWINRQEKGEEDCTKLLAWWIALLE